MQTCKVSEYVGFPRIILLRLDCTVLLHLRQSFLLLKKKLTKKTSEHIHLENINNKLYYI